MRAFSEHNSIAIFVHFMLTIIIAMFIQNPIILLLALFGSILYYAVTFRKISAKTLIFWILLFLLISLINPIFSHKGETVLLFINGKAITLEALFYGINNGIMILAVMIWFLVFSEIMTSDKVMYIFGKFSPRLALLVSMSLRYIPLYRQRASIINNAQKTMGLYKESNIVDNVKGGMRVTSSLITWSLETSVDTADSFAARGGELKHRNSFSIFKFRKNDVALIIISIVLFSAVISAQAMGILSVDYYSSGNFLNKLSFEFIAIVAYSAYFILSVIPFILEISARK
ncbi:energy-coupling factor transporter transmembrane component T [Candidatus Pseudoruminococcus sp.]|uniref:energy-coupling factor transporter transmembrane component T n=1 Tax=Candidatus Pseudoruminococcus sp. TaxID=3101048 RepID=UPI00399C3F95